MKTIICEKCEVAYSVTIEEGGIVYCPYCGKQYTEHNKAYLYIKSNIETDLERMLFREERGIKEDRQYYWGMIDLAKSMEIITWDEASKLYKRSDI